MIVKYAFPVSVSTVIILAICWLAFLTATLKYHRTEEHDPSLTNKVPIAFYYDSHYSEALHSPKASGDNTLTTNLP